MKIKDLLNKDLIIHEMESTNKAELINELIDLLKQNSKVKDLEKLRKAVFERENLLSTGIGKGIAIPHCRTDAVEGIILAFGKTKVPIDFESLDNKPVFLVFLLASSENMNVEHLIMMKKIGSIARNDELLNRIVSSIDSEEIYNLFSESDYSTAKINNKI